MDEVAQGEGYGVDEGAHVDGEAGDDADLEAGDVGHHLGSDVCGYDDYGHFRQHRRALMEARLFW